MVNFKPETRSFKHLIWVISALLLLSMMPFQSMAAEKTDRYVVKKGDTLWDIAKRFLNDPWLWPEVWHINPKIRNPHLIYPGDVVALYYVDGKPYITLEGKGGVPAPTKNGLKTVRLSPRAHMEPLEKAITTLPYELIAPFLKHASVMSDDDLLDDAPYIVSSFEGHLVSGSEHKIYAMGVEDTQVGQYTIVRPGPVYRDPDSDDILGYEVKHIADARLIKTGEPATLIVGETNQEVLNEDRLIPYVGEKQDFYFYPSPPSQQVNGSIISVLGDGVSQIGQYNAVVINRGEADGLVVGNVLAVFQAGELVRDRVGFQPVRLPDERAGLLMIFQTFEKVSYGLILEAERSMGVYDRVTNP
ncbi:MAG: LysM peptidoglycan-binding domain-containing protein [Gammaproteobacteria bacterium]|nr:LysM peptidoglycan-binding domain-containing protein [Gammaproteobacteria bacterium]